MQFHFKLHATFVPIENFRQLNIPELQVTVFVLNIGFAATAGDRPLRECVRLRRAAHPQVRQQRWRHNPSLTGISLKKYKILQKFLTGTNPTEEKVNRAD
jgi:hypothetical protein